MTEQAQPPPFPRQLVHQSSQVRLDYWKRVHGGSSCLEAGGSSRLECAA